MLNIRVGNIKAGDEGEYIGRAFRGRKGSPLANPYRVPQVGRLGAIRLYRQWLSYRIAEGDAIVMAELARLAVLAQRPKGVTLLCWCAPDKACHGDVIAEVLREREE